MHNSGFSMLELLVSMFILSICMLLFVPAISIDSFNRYEFIYEYFLTQSNAMYMQEPHVFNSHYSNIYHNYQIRFNEFGHVNQAQTVVVDEFNKEYEIVIQLGGGRIVYKK